MRMNMGVENKKNFGIVNHLKEKFDKELHISARRLCRKLGRMT